MKTTIYKISLIALVFCMFLFLPEFTFAQSAAELNKQSEKIINENPEKSLELGQRAIRAAIIEKNKQQEGYGYLNTGVGYYYLDGYDTAITIVEKGLKIARTNKIRLLEGKCLNVIGEIYVYTAEYAKSLKYLSDARTIFEKLDAKIDLARSNNNMGIIHKNQYNLNEAGVYFRKALELGDDVRKGDASLYLGQVYILQKKYTDADKILKTAVEFAQKNKDNYVLADAYTGLGQVNMNFGKKEEALFYLEGALKIKVEVDDLQGISIVSNALGNLWLQNDDANKAHMYFLRSMKIAEEIDVREQLKDAYLGVSNSFHLKNADDSAYLYLDKYNRLNELILSQEASKKLSQIEDALTAEKEKQKIEHEKKIQKQKEEHDAYINALFTWVFIGIILIMSVFAYIMYNRYRLKQKANLEILKQKEEVERQKIVAEEQKLIIEEKNHEITDSINYAKRIQTAVLPTEEEFKKSFTDSFVLFKPKDIVSGDFYWFTKTKTEINTRRGGEIRGGFVEQEKELIIYVTADCTGHGVPGGFMSMLGTSLLNEIINERKFHDPSKALDMLREKIINDLKQTGVSGENKDGMDLVLTVYDLKNKKLTYSAANNGFYILRNGNLLEYKADKQPIGYYGDAMKPFTKTEIQLEDGDCIYTFTDGYADQFGGPKGKKFKYKTLENKLLDIYQLPMSEQKIILDDVIESWRGDLEQNDDICLIGVRI